MTENEAKRQPRALILLFSPSWMGPARLPETLHEAGFLVGSLCHGDSYLAQSGFNSYLVAMPEEGSAWPNLVAAVRSERPDILIPACDLAIRFLHNIVDAENAGRLAPESADVTGLVRRSLGDPQGHRRAASKIELHALAEELGLAVPRQVTAADIDQARAFADTTGYPVVLKGEYGAGGHAVRICATARELEEAWQVLRQQDAQQRLSVSEYVRGTLAAQASVSWDGEVLETLTLAKIQTHPGPTGPSSVLQRVDHPAAEHTARVLIGRLGISGFSSVDLILDEEHDRAVVLEINLRPTPGCMIGRLWGRDHGLVLASKLSGADYSPESMSELPQRVALFPNEWLRDRGSPHLIEDHHDVPWRDPRLLKAFVERLVR